MRGERSQIASYLEKNAAVSLLGYLQSLHVGRYFGVRPAGGHVVCDELSAATSDAKGSWLSPIGTRSPRAKTKNLFECCTLAMRSTNTKFGLYHVLPLAQIAIRERTLCRNFRSQPLNQASALQYKAKKEALGIYRLVLQSTERLPDHV